MIMNIQTPTNLPTQTDLIVRPAIVSLILFTLILGVLYPLLITAASQAILPGQANGSLIVDDTTGQILGSSLIGQEFSDPKYFWGRLSATGPIPYNAAASSGSNLGPLNPALIGTGGTIQTRIAALAAANAAAGIASAAPIPVDLVTASASGLDPHISPAAAAYQRARVATVRGLAEETVNQLIRHHTEGRTFGLFGEARVNVLALNRSLDALAASATSAQ